MTLLPWLPLWLVLAVPIVALTRAVVHRTLAVQIVMHLPAFSICALLDATTRRFVAGDAPVSFPTTLLYFADLTLLSYVAIVVAALMALARWRLLAAEQRAIIGRDQLMRARMRWFESQLQPHFLFNTIHTILEVAETSRSTARNALIQLHGALRSNLRDDVAGEIALADELANLDRYLSIQQLRFADWLTIQRHIDPSAMSLVVPRLVLQPLVENAIQHGLRGRLEPGTLTIAAQASPDHRLVLCVSDDGHGMRGSHVVAHERLGLTNVRARLATLYGDDFSLRLASARGVGTSTILEIPARRVGASIGDETRTLERVASNDFLTNRDAALWRRAASRPVVTAMLLWIVWGLLWSHQSYSYLALRGRLGDASYLDVLLRDGSAALLWAVLSIPVLTVVRRVEAFRRWPRIAALVLTTIVAAWTHAALFLALSGEVLAADGVMALMPTDLLLAGIVVLVALRESIERWILDREHALATDEEALTRARFDASVVRAQVEEMASDLVCASDIIDADVDEAASILVTMSERLRAILTIERAGTGSVNASHGVNAGCAA